MTRRPSSRSGRRAGTNSTSTSDLRTTRSPGSTCSRCTTIPPGRCTSALVREDPDRRDRPLSPDARRQRLPADRVRRLRAARGERGDQEPDQPARVDDGEHRHDAAPAADDGRRLGLDGRGRHLRPRLLSLEPVAVPAVPRAGARLSRGLPGRLVPQRRDARARAGRGRRPPLLVLRREGGERALASGTCGHRLRGRAARLSGVVGRTRSGSCRRTDRRSTGAEIVFDSTTAPPRGRRGGPHLRHAARTRSTAPTFMHPGADASPRRRGPPAPIARPTSRRTSRAAADQTEIDPLFHRSRTACRSARMRSFRFDAAHIPIFIADYVLGTSAPAPIIAVPAHDGATSRSRPRSAADRRCHRARDANQTCPDSGVGGQGGGRGARETQSPRRPAGRHRLVGISEDSARLRAWRQPRPVGPARPRSTHRTASSRRPSAASPAISITYRLRD